MGLFKGIIHMYRVRYTMTNPAFHPPSPFTNSRYNGRNNNSMFPGSRQFLPIRRFNQFEKFKKFINHYLMTFVPFRKTAIDTIVPASLAVNDNSRNSACSTRIS